MAQLTAQRLEEVKDTAFLKECINQGMWVHRVPSWMMTCIIALQDIHQTDDPIADALVFGHEEGVAKHYYDAENNIYGIEVVSNPENPKCVVGPIVEETYGYFLFSDSQVARLKRLGIIV